MKKTIIIIAVLAVVGIGAYIINKSYSGTPAYTPPAPNNQNVSVPAPAPAPENPAPPSVTVDIKNFSFNPSAVTVKTGTKVTWTNNDSVSHTVTSDSGNLLDSPILSPGQSFSFTFTNPGSANYHCNIHHMMKGAIVIEK